MNDRHARYGAATGIFFVVLVIIAFFVQPKPPAADASAAEVFEYVTDKQDSLHVVQLIFGLAGFFLLWFVGTLRALMGAAEGGAGRLADIAFGSILVAFATLLVGLGLQATAALHPVANGPELTHALVDVSLIVPALGAPAVAVFFVATGLGILRTGYLPAWLGWLGLVAAAFNAIAISPVFTDSGAFAADGVLGFFSGFLLFLLWFLLAGILLVRKLGDSDAGAAAA